MIADEKARASDESEDVGGAGALPDATPAALAGREVTHRRVWIEYRLTGDGPWLEREFDSVAEAERWAHAHLGVDVTDVSTVHLPELDHAVPRDWLDAGWTSLGAVAQWTCIGIESPMLAQEWIDAGFTPESAGMWVEIEGMRPSQAMEAVNTGVAPIDVERIQRADPDWERPAEPEIAKPGMGIWL